MLVDDKRLEKGNKFPREEYLDKKRMPKKALCSFKDERDVTYL